MGNISVIDHPEAKYSCRIIDPEMYIASDIIIDYSMQNLYNMESTMIWNPFVKKVIYLPALLYDYQASLSPKTIDIATTMIILHGRRDVILSDLSAKGIYTTNFWDNYDHTDLSRIYSTARIILNIHQTENHHTLEEFRVLPALLRGAIVVSEDIPIKHVVPYHNYIIWSHTKDLHDTLKNVSTHYEYFYERIHGKDSGLRQVVEEMKMKARRDLEHRLLEVMEEKVNPTIRTEYSLPDWVLHPKLYRDHPQAPEVLASAPSKPSSPMDNRPHSDTPSKHVPRSPILPNSDLYPSSQHPHHSSSSSSKAKVSQVTVVVRSGKGPH